MLRVSPTEFVFQVDLPAPPGPAMRKTFDALPWSLAFHGPWVPLMLGPTHGPLWANALCWPPGYMPTPPPPSGHAALPLLVVATFPP